MTASKTAPIHVLRSILRHLKTSPDINVESHKVTRAYVMEQYRSSVSISEDRATVLRKLAYDYSQLQKDLAERARLHDLDTGADNKLTPKELSRRAAARAGLQLPKLDPDLK
mmetsp:Transcript_10238/g.12301  ORF Transcript_10238/g.12301 Transcript_10238/m.12301 type:complete len:112 (-) Transcript_10238:58-393(-)